MAAGTVYYCSMTSNDDYAHGFINFVVIRSHLRLVLDREVGLNPFDWFNVLDSGIFSLYVVSESTL